MGTVYCHCESECYLDEVLPSFELLVYHAKGDFVGLPQTRYVIG